jgi:serine-type D-Ala-D-Ala carboxypeptidase/endopeptidase (penicillin-binding protein 4)
VGSGLAWASGPTALPDPPKGAMIAAATPVLSVRRVPGLVRRELADRRLRTRIDAALRDPAFGDATSASCFVVEHRGRAVHEVRADLALIPASNLKLLTATAALTALGPDHRFVTEIKAAALPNAEGVVEGDLYVVGGGDPVLMTDEYAVAQRFQPQLVHNVDDVAAAISAAGVKEVRGAVVGDESRYDQVRYILTWKTSYRVAEVGPMSALAANDGFAAIGNPSSDPAALSAALVANAAERAGVVLGEVRSGPAPAGLVTLGAVQSPPLAEIVSALMRVSDNNTAELLVKELGFRAAGQGTTTRGLAAVREQLTEVGLEIGQATLTDGSGLDRGSRIPCRSLMGVLRQAGPAGPIFEGLAVAGRSGTLADRFTTGPATGRVRAKTGALAGVIGFTGWTEGTSDQLAFSLLANGLPGEAAGLALQERVGNAVALYPEAPPLDRLGPRPAA